MTVNPDGTPGPVAPGEIIDSDWGNAVSQSVEALWATKHSPVGGIMLWGTNSAPALWAICDGSAVSRATYAELFERYGTAWGAGDGTTTFNIPDLRNVFPIGRSAGDALTGNLNSRGGGRDAVLPYHAHGADVSPGALPHLVPRRETAYAGAGRFLVPPDNGTVGDGNYDGVTSTPVAGSVATHQHLFIIGAGMALTEGSDGTHDHGIGIAPEGVGATNGRMPPFCAINFIIRMLPETPSL